MVFDHDLFSFVDATIAEWPLVLITNPKNAKYLVTSREPSARMLHSSHVRILAFSTAAIVSMRLEIDGVELVTPVPVDNGPLYVSPWQPAKYSLGLHIIRVKVTDAIGRSTIFEQVFTLDDTVLLLDKFPQMLLLTDLHSLVCMIR